jgi:hypothetical protein
MSVSRPTRSSPATSSSSRVGVPPSTPSSSSSRTQSSSHTPQSIGKGRPSRNSILKKNLNEEDLSDQAESLVKESEEVLMQKSLREWWSHVDTQLAFAWLADFKDEGKPLITTRDFNNREKIIDILINSIGPDGLPGSVFVKGKPKRKPYVINTNNNKPVENNVIELQDTWRRLNSLGPNEEAPGLVERDDGININKNNNNKNKNNLSFSNGTLHPNQNITPSSNSFSLSSSSPNESENKQKRKYQNGDTIPPPIFSQNNNKKQRIEEEEEEEEGGDEKEPQQGGCLNYYGEDDMDLDEDDDPHPSKSSSTKKSPKDIYRTQATKLQAFATTCKCCSSVNWVTIRSQGIFICTECEMRGDELPDHQINKTRRDWLIKRNSQLAALSSSSSSSSSSGSSSSLLGNNNNNIIKEKKPTDQWETEFESILTNLSEVKDFSNKSPLTPEEAKKLMSQTFEGSMYAAASPKLDEIIQTGRLVDPGWSFPRTITEKRNHMQPQSLQLSADSGLITTGKKAHAPDVRSLKELTLGTLGNVNTYCYSIRIKTK